MAFIAAIGAAVAGAFGASVAVGGIASMVIGGVVVGAAVGALYSAVTGGNILKGMLFGAVGGAVLGFGGAAMGFGGAATSTAGAGAMEAASVPGAAIGTGGGAFQVAGTNAVGGAATSAAGSAASGAAGLFSKEGLSTIGSVMKFGGAFLKGGSEIDADAQVAENEKDRQLQKDLMDKRSAQVAEQIASNEKMAADKLAFEKESWQAEFDESKFRDRDTREKEEAKRQAHESGIADASQYVAGTAQAPSVVAYDAQNRQGLPAPTWKTKKEVTQNGGTQGLTGQATA